MATQHRQEEALRSELDSIIDIENEKLDGELLRFETLNQEEAPAFIFKHRFAEEELQIPYEQALLIQFRSNEITADLDTIATIELTADGRLSITDLILKDQEFIFKHPLLGEITLPRSTVKSATSF